MSASRSSESPARRRGRPPATDSESTRLRILHTARRLFGQDGYAQTSMEAIATEADVTPRAVYHYFDSKQALFTAAARSALDRMLGDIAERVMPATTTRERLHAFLDIYRDVYAEDPTLLSFTSMAVLEANRDPDLPSPLSEDEVGGVFLGLLVDEAMRNHDLADDVGRDGAITLMQVVGTGLTMLATAEGPTLDYLAMLDALDRLIDGTLFTD